MSVCVLYTIDLVIVVLCMKTGIYFDCHHVNLF